VTAPRVGCGLDVHPFEQGRECWLGGILLEDETGLAGHSDGDVAAHAICDAVLGAAGLGDIGEHFPPGDPQWKGVSGVRMLQETARLARAAGWEVANADLTVVCERPRLSPHRAAMTAAIAGGLAVAVEAVSVKGTTTDRLGFVGRGEGIAAMAVALLVPAGKRAQLVWRRRGPSPQKR